DGLVFITVNDFDKSAALKIGRDLARMGFKLAATRGTAALLQRAGIEVLVLNRMSEGEQPTVRDYLREGKISLIINTPLGRESFSDGQRLRQEASRRGIPLVTTLTAAQAAVNGIRVLQSESLRVRSLQDLYQPG
ncbi:MAG: carbamoyl phosphate synthase large subunit, partial [Chloroflexi bacterium]